MKLEAKKFRPREVVKHVLQMTLASVQHKHLVLEGDVADEVPVEVRLRFSLCCTPSSPWNLYDCVNGNWADSNDSQQFTDDPEHVK